MKIREQHKKSISDFFSLNTEFWRDIYDEPGEGESRSFSLDIIKRKEIVVKMIEKHTDTTVRILDAGCGAGVFMKELLGFGYSVVGIDLSDNMLKQARRLIKNYGPDKALCMQADVEQLPFDDDSFDVVLCVGVLSYIKNDAEAIHEISRVVMNDGIVIIAIPNIFRLGIILDPYYYFIRLIQYFIHKVLSRNKDKTVDAKDFGLNKSFAIRKYYYGQLNKLFCRFHLKRLETSCVGFGPLTFWKKEYMSYKISNNISKKLTCHKLFSFMKVFSNHWVICLQKTKT